MPKVNKSTEPRTGAWFTLLTIICGLWLPDAAAGQVVAKRTMVEVRTSLGTMVIALYNETPDHRDRFISRVKAGEMDSLLFHRVIPGFAVEGGDPASAHAPAGTPLGLNADSIGLPLVVVPGAIHKKGALSATPAGDDPALGKRSHSELFFFVLGVTYTEEELDRIAARNASMGAPFTYTEEDRRTYAIEGGQPRLDGSYTVFGEVIAGLEILDAMAASRCNTWDRPMEDIRMYMRLLP
jgi:cyclophilin family peptidyl-prolyl cis-trans isomerase